MELTDLAAPGPPSVEAALLEIVHIALRAPRIEKSLIQGVPSYVKRRTVASVTADAWLDSQIISAQLCRLWLILEHHIKDPAAIRVPPAIQHGSFDLVGSVLYARRARKWCWSILVAASQDDESSKNSRHHIFSAIDKYVAEQRPHLNTKKKRYEHVRENGIPTLENLDNRKLELLELPSFETYKRYTRAPGQKSKRSKTPASKPIHAS